MAQLLAFLLIESIELRQAGLSHPLMDEIERMLIARWMRRRAS